jgi:hypothetical protein
VRRGTDPCPGFKTDVDWSANVLSFSAPRTCLGTPKYVIVHVEDWSSTFDETTGYQSWFDNAHNAESDEKGWTGKIKTG